jgi:serine/threonine protein kinase
MPDLEGVMLSDYLLLKCISHGGVADVYRARQNIGGDYEVAVKIYQGEYAERTSFRNYFMSEAEKVGQLDHSNILPLLEFGEGDGLLYVVTPYITTGTLLDFLRRVGGRLSAIQAEPVVQQLCSALYYAHERGVIHGNIKPTNIFIGPDGRVLLADFGVARGYQDSQESLTRIGWGTAEYVAPEQSLGLLRPASDIYTVGTILFLILTGQPPFSGQTPVEVLLKHVRQPAPSARQFAPGVSDAVDRVLQKALQKRTDDRYATAEELSLLFSAAVQIAPVATPLAPQPELQHVAAPAFASGGPRTPFPAIVPPSPLSDPETPTPTYLAAPTARPAPLPAGPVEWSPLAPDAPGARDYLSSTPTASPAPQPVGVAKKETQKRHGNVFLSKVLPVLVIVVLLLGLAAALLSSFFFPGG